MMDEEERKKLLAETYKPCPTCGNVKNIHLRCLHCHKPTIETKTVRVLNYIDAIRYIKTVLNKPYLGEKIHHYLCDKNLIVNDSIVYFYLGEDEINEDVQFFIDTFEITMDDPVILEISW